MNKILKAVAVTSLVLGSASAFAWGNGPFDGFSNGFSDVANQFFGDGFGDGDADFNMNMSGGANGTGWGRGRGYDRFQGYNGYGYAPGYGHGYAPYYGYGYPGAPVAMTAPQGPVAPIAPQAPVAQ